MKERKREKERERERKKSGGDRGTMAPKGESLSQEHLEARVNGALLKEALKEVGKAFFAFDSCVEQKQGGEGDEDETSASFTRANNALDNLAMKLTKVNLAIKALNADRDQYEESRKRSGEESAEVSLVRSLPPSLSLSLSLSLLSLLSLVLLLLLFL